MLNAYNHNLSAEAAGAAVLTPGQDEHLPFFVYGTLRSGQGNYQRLLAGKTTAIITAAMKNTKMYAQGVAYVTDALAQDGGELCQVVGDLMFVKPGVYPQVLVSLDGLEGYNSTTHSGHYIRVKRKATFVDPKTGETREVMAWVYFAGKSTKSSLRERDRVLDGDWLQWLRSL